MDKPKQNDRGINVDVGRSINVDVGMNKSGDSESDNEATSRATMRSVESNESEQDNKEEDSSGATPSPDGQFDGSRGGKDDAGPM